MKKFIVLSFLMAIVSISASARKSYIDIYAQRFSYAEMTGEVPQGVADFKYYEESGVEYVTYDGSPGQLLNILAGYGYEVEFMSVYSDYHYAAHYLLSKEISSNQTQSKGDLNEDGSVNISDLNELINMILGYVKEHPEIMERIK